MKFDLEKLIGERGKRALFTMLVGLIGGLICVSGFEIVFDEEQAEPQAISFADLQPQTDDRECFVRVRVRGLVDLARPLEVHCETTGPAVDCESVTGQLWTIDQTVKAKLGEPDSLILARVKSPAPDRVMIGEWISYRMTVRGKQNCQPEEPSDKPKPDGPTKPRPKKD